MATAAILDFQFRFGLEKEILRNHVEEDVPGTQNQISKSLADDL